MESTQLRVTTGWGPDPFPIHDHTVVTCITFSTDALAQPRGLTHRTPRKAAKSVSWE